MSSALLFLGCGGLIFAIGLYGLFVHRHILRKIVAANVAVGGVYLVLIAGSTVPGQHAADPVPQALALTGIVIAVSITAFALALLQSLYARTGARSLDGEGDR